MPMFKDAVAAAIQQAKDEIAADEADAIFDNEDGWVVFIRAVTEENLGAAMMTPELALSLITHDPEILGMRPWEHRTVAHSLASAAVELAYPIVHDAVWTWAQDLGIDVKRDHPLQAL